MYGRVEPCRSSATATPPLISAILLASAFISLALFAAALLNPPALISRTVKPRYVVAPPVDNGSFVHITVKTTEANVKTRLNVLRRTWLDYSKKLESLPNGDPFLKAYLVTDHDLQLLPKEAAPCSEAYKSGTRKHEPKILLDGPSFRPTILNLLRGRFPLPKKILYFLFVLVDNPDQCPVFHDILSGAHLRVVNSGCGSTYVKQDMCCKTRAELETYYATQNAPRWFCRFDDDNYVNLDNLISLLSNYDTETQDLYIGRRSVPEGIIITVTDSDGLGTTTTVNHFLTGGAGVCVSKKLMTRLKPIIHHPYRTGGFFDLCHRMGQVGDDMVLGYILTEILAVNITELGEFNSHLNNQAILSRDEVVKAVSLSYGRHFTNTVRVPWSFWNLRTDEDPTRFLSLDQYLKRRGFFVGLPPAATPYRSPAA